MAESSTMELEMRIDGESDCDALRERAEDALRALDPGAAVRLDPATGIAHVTTSCQALEIEDALVRAGIGVTAPTG